MLVNQKQILKGRVIVTRSPSVHPGDIRSLQCVDRAELRHLENVIVFSSKGDRPTCSKMSCGDLDGDLYLVIWNRDLVNSIKEQDIVPPAPLQQDLTEQNVQFDRLIGSEDIRDFYTFFLERDILGPLANTWV